MSIISLSSFSYEINWFSTWAPVSSRCITASPKYHTRAQGWLCILHGESLLPTAPCQSSRRAAPAAACRSRPDGLLLLELYLESNGIAACAALARLCAVHTHLWAEAGNWLNTDVIIKNVILSGYILLIRTYFWLINGLVLLVTQKPEIQQPFRTMGVPCLWLITFNA